MDRAQTDQIKVLRDVLKTNQIEFILLDMDGTLLDKYFDDYFWGHLVPETYAAQHDITFGRAEEELLAKYKAQEGTLNWTDVDFWSRELGLDIMALKEQIRHLIEVHPHVMDFLEAMKAKNKSIYIVTNAHYKVLDIKLKKTKLGEYLTGAITSMEVGYPKEDVRFWEGARRRLNFRKDAVLFIDDTLDCLRAAKKFGLSYLVYKAMSSSKLEAVLNTEFASIFDFDELLDKDNNEAK